MKTTQKKVLLFLLCGISFAFSFNAFGTAITSNGTGNWNAPATWSPAQVPGVGDDVTIRPGDNVTVSANAAANSVTFSNTAATVGTITVTAGFTLTVTTSIAFQNSASLNTAGTLTGGGAITAASMTIGGTIAPTSSRTVTVVSTITSLSITGSVTVTSQRPAAVTSNPTFQIPSGVVSIGGTLNCVTANSALSTTLVTLQIAPQSGTLNLAGAITTSGNAGVSTFSFNGTTSIVNYNGVVAQTVRSVTYRTLKINNAAGVSSAAAFTVTNLTIGDVTASSIFSDGGFQVTGTGTVNLASGTFNLGSAAVGTTWPAFTTNTIGAGTTVAYLSGVAQTVSGTPSYQNLTLSGAGQKNASNAITVNTLSNASVFDMAAFTLAATTISSNATIRFSGANGQAINLGTIEYYGASQTVTAGTYTNLNINQSSGDAILGGTTTVNGVLTLTAHNLDIATYNLLLGSAATITDAAPSASRMIIASGGSEVRKTFTATGSFTFPIGDNTGTLEYSPVTVNVTSAGGFSSAYVGASVVDAKHPNNSSTTNYITRYWNIDQSGITSCVATVTGTYVAVDINGTEASTKAAQLNGTFNQSTNPWVKYAALGGNTLTATGATITSGQVSAFTGITGANPTVGIAGGGVTICSGSSAALTATGTGDPTFIYSWSPSTGLSSAAIANPTASPGTTTAYTVTATDGNGITATNNTTITVNPVPTLTGASQSANVCAGVGAVINLTGLIPSSTSTINYSINGVAQAPVAGVVATAAGTGNFTTSNLTAANNGENLQITGITITSSAPNCSQSFTRNVTLTVNSPSAIVTQPTASQTLCVGSALNLSVTASGTGLTYQWKKGGIAIGGATSSTFTKGSVVAGDAATYTVDVTSSGVCVPATVTSGNAVVNVDSPASISVEPTASQTLCVGSALNLSVTASGTGLTYQWQKNGVAIGGATSSTYSIGSVVAGDAANYTVVVSSSSVVCVPSNVTSTLASVTVNSPSAIVTQPTASQTLCVGGALNLSVTASGTGLTYQWKKGGIAIGGATSSTFTKGSVVAGDAATYTVDVTSSGVCVPATVTSGNAVVNVDSPASISVEPTASQTLCVGSALNLSVTASGTGLTYQWQKNGVAIGGATSSTYSIGSVVAGDAANYTVVVSSSSVVCVPSSVTSTLASVTVNSPSAIVTQPTASQTLCVGGALNLSVTASGTGLTYQWKKGGIAIGGATSNTYSIGSVVAGDAATYTVDVTSSGVCVPATVTSGNAVVNVDSPASISVEPTASQTLCVGSALNLSVTASGTGLTYQWQKNGVAIGGATSSTYSIGSVVAGDAANYTVVVSSSSVVCVPSNVTSTLASVTVNSPSAIVTQPTASQTLCVGGALNLSVTASGTGLTYQWKKGGIAIGGATSNTYSIGSVVAGDAATYTVDVTSSGICVPATVTSGNAVVNVDSPASISVEPTASQTLCVGSALNLSVTASGTGLTYQWQKNGVAIGGATSSTYSIGSVVAGDAANYTVVVSSSSVVCVPSSVTSTLASVTVNSPSAIVTQPTASQTLCVGSALNLSVTASGTGLTYQWKKGGIAIGGATSSTFTKGSVVAGDAATYTVDVTSSGVCVPATVTSGNAVVNVDSPASISVEPTASQTLCVGGALNLSVTASGTGLTYQWQKNGVAIGGATSSTYSIGSVVAGDAANYTVVVSSSSVVCVPSSVTSTLASVTVNSPSAIATQPTASQTLCVGGALNLSVTASGTGLTYQWKKGGIAIGGATSNTYSIGSVVAGDAATYTVDVTSSGICVPATVTSGNAVVNVDSPASISVEPTASQTLCVGSALNLSVTASGTGLTYQWQKNGVAIGGATSSTYSIGSVVAGDAANYTVVVSSSSVVCVPSSVTSTLASVTVNSPSAIVTQPTASQTLCVGGALNLSVTASGTGLTYQWKKGGIAIGGATSNTYSIGSVVAGDAATYTVDVTSSGICVPATVTSGNAVVNVDSPASISVEPTASQTLCVGSALNLSVTASGTGLTYQWQKNGVAIGGATSSTYSIGSVVAGDAANYTVVVSSSSVVCVPSNVTSTLASVTVNSPSAIVTQPTASQTLCVGGALNLSVTASGTGLTYQWKKGGIAIGGATSNTYSIGSVVAGDAATYTVDVTSSGICVPATVTSGNAVVNVNPVPVGTAVPTGTYATCSGTALNITPSSTVPGTTFTWTGNDGSAGSGNITDSPINASNSPLDVTYTVIPTGPGTTFCVGSSFTIVATANPNPTFSITNSAATICSGATTNLLFNSSTTGHRINVVSVNYNGAGNSGTIIPGTTTFVNGNSLVETLTNATNAPINVVYGFNVTTPSTSPVCPSSPVTQFVTVQVNPVPTFSITNTTGTICSGNSTDITLSTPTTNGIITLTSVAYNGATGGTQINGNTFTNGQKILESLTNSGNTPITINYTFTVSANGCNNLTSQSTSVTLNPLPVITNTPTQLQTTICSAVALNFTASSTIAGTTYTWTSAIAGPVTAGSVTASGGGAITDSPVNSGNVVGTVTYTITPHTATCAGTAVNYVVTVNPIPTVAASNQSICSGQTSSVAISNPNSVSGTSYSWTIQSSSNVTGAVAGSGASINQVLSSTDGITVGTVTYLITPSANGCAGTALPVTVTVNAVPVITNTPTQLQTTICSAVALNFTASSTIAGTTYTWTSAIAGPVTAGSVTASGGGAITDSPVNSGNVVGTVTYTITPHTATCAGTAVNYVVTVNPIPTVAASNQSICSGQTSSVAISNPNSVSGTSYSWTIQSSSNVTGAVAGSGASINQVLSSTDGITVGTVTYLITPSANGCAGTALPVTVTVNAVPVITNTPTQLQTTICSAVALNFTASSTIAGTTYTWTSAIAGPVTAGSVTASGGGAITDSPVNSGNVVGTVTYTITPHTATCAGTAVNYVVTVNPIPTVAASNQSICSGQTSSVVISNPNSVSGTSYSWTIQSSSNVTGAVAGSGASINQVLSSTDGITVGTVTYLITPSANGCAGTALPVTVTVNAVPVITNTPTQLQTTICSAVALNFTASSTIAGTTYTWTSAIAGPVTAGSVTASGGGAITDSPVNSGNVVGTVTYTITPHTATCAGTAVNYVVTVNPIPTVAASNQSICSGQTSSVVISNPNSVSGTSYSWTIQSSSNVTGAVAGSGASINQVLSSTDGITVGTVTYLITPSANGCAGTALPVTVTVNAVPVITNTPTQLQTTICSAVALNFTASSTIAGTTYTWTSAIAGPVTAGSVTASGGGAITDSPVNSGNVVGTVTYTITPHTATCAGTAVNYVVTVNPIPTVAASNQSICSGQTSSVVISNPNSVSGTSYSWTIQSSSNVTGAVAGSGASINQVLSSTDGITVGTVTYLITPSANGCAGTALPVTVTVNAVPVITNTPTQLQTTICSAVALNFTASSTIAGTTYTWTSAIAGPVTAGSVTASGGGAITDSPVNSGNVVGTVTYTITPHTATCAGTAVNYVVTVNPIPTVAASNQSICSGQTSSVVISNPNSVSGTSYSWTIQSSSNVTGAVAGSGASINQVLSSTDGITVGTVTYLITPSANGCAGTALPVTVTVNAVPVITNTPTQLQTTICSAVALNFTASSTIAGTTYTWTSAIAGPVTAGSVTASGGGAITDSPVNSGNVVGTVTYTITPHTATCAGTAVNYVVTVNPIPTVAASNQSICSGQTSSVVISNPNSVSGTSYSWTIQSSSNVTGAVAGSGASINQVLSSTDGITVGTVTYLITPSANGCAGTALPVTVTVNAVPVITNTPTQLQTTICSAVALNFTASSTIAGTTYTWTSAIAGPVTAGSVTASGGGAITDSPVNSGNVVGTVTYTITPHTATCVGTAVNYVVTVNPIPTVAASNQSICSGQTSSVAISNPNSVSGTSYSWTIQSSSNVTGAVAGSGASINQVLSSTDGITVGTVTYLITPSANGCAGTALPVTVTVNAVPVITNTPTQLQTTICSAVALNFTASSTIAGTTYSWTSAIAGPITGVTASGSSTIMDSPVNTGNVSGTIVYHITPTVGTCNGLAKDYVVTVEPVPSATASNITICSGQNAVIAITAGPQNVAGTTFSWTVVPSANVLGAFAGNGSTIDQVLSLTDYNIGTVTYHITPLANGCTGTPINAIVTIDPVALVDAGADYAVCQPATILLAGTIGGAATSGTWQIVTGGGTISASTVSGTAVTATYTVVPGDITTTAVFRLLTNDPDGAGLPCVAVSDLLNVAINRAPTVTLPANYVVCEPATISLTGTIGGSASTGLWNIVTGNGTLSATNVSGTTVTANYTVNPSDVSTTVTFSLTTNDADGPGPCTAASANINVTINQSAKVFAPATLAICQNFPSIVLGGSIGGSTVTTAWTGGGSGSSFSNAADPNATYFLAPSEKNKTTPITIPLTLTALDPDGAGPCTSTSTQTNLTVNPLPLVFFSGFTTTYLAENSSPVTLNGSQVGGQFMVAPSNQTLTTVANPGDQAVFDPSTVPLGLNTVTYTYTDGNGCTNSSAQDIIINPVTVVDFVLVANPGGQTVRLNASDQYEVCANQGKILISGVPLPSTGNPGSLITKFKGVIGRGGGPIIPVQADPLNVDNWYILTDGLTSDIYAVEYDYENTLFAATSKTRTIKILAGPTAGISAPSSCVKDSIKFTDISTMPGTFGGAGNPFSGAINSWSWNLDPFLSSQQNPTITYPLNDPGKKYISLTVYTNQGCSSQDTTHITVGDYPVPDFNWSSICTFDKTNFVDETIFNSGQGNIVNYDWNFGDGTIISGAPLTAAPEGGVYRKPVHVYSTNGQYTVKMTVNTDVGCNQSITRQVSILVTTGTIAPSAASAYNEDFQASNGGWVPEALDTAASSNYSWIWGLPNGANDITPLSAGNTSWWTGGNSNTYFNKENSAINGPCFDLSKLNRPMVSLDYWIDAALNYDGAVMQYSTDGGLQWDIIGSVVLAQRAQGINWYKPGTTILGNPGGQPVGPYGWTGTPKMWLNGRFNLDMIPNDTISRKQVRMRIAFSDYGSLSGYDGFAFDNFFVGEKTKNVLVEHFTNANPNPNLADPNLSVEADAYFNNLYANQISFRKGQTDFNDIQYHVRFPQPDVFSLTNSDDPAARALYYNVQQVPYTVSDGVFSTGVYTQVDSIEIDARALRTPPLTISSIDTTGTSGYTNRSINVQMNIRADTAITYPLYGQVALIETPVVISAPDPNPGTYQNVVRKLLFAGDGVTKSKNMAQNDTQVFSKGQIAIDATIKDPNNLYIVAFVQNFATKEVLQSVIMPINRKVGSTVTAIESSVGNLDQVNLYPNPAKSKFNMSLDGNFPSPCIWKIADQNGIYIMEGNFNDAFDGVKTVNISSLTNGVYFVIIGSPGRNPVYKKLVVLNAN